MLPLEEQLLADWPPSRWVDVTTLVAVSGGADSTALLLALRQLKNSHGGRGQLAAAHLNHLLRGAAAEEEQQWLTRLCAQWSIRLYVGRRNVGARAAVDKDGIEAAARGERYEFLQETAEQIGARYVATAHTADDQVETVLHRILRGTGLRGLAGIPASRPLGEMATLVRPMLQITRQQVLSYLEERGQAFCHDTSNRDPAFTRNRLRHQLLPLLRAQYNDRIDEALLRLSQQARALQQAFQPAIDPLLEASTTLSATRITFDVRRLAKLPEPMLRELIRAAWRRAGWPEQAMTQAHWQRLGTLIQTAAAATAMFPATVEARREGERLVLSKGGSAQE